MEVEISDNNNLGLTVFQLKTHTLQDVSLAIESIKRGTVTIGSVFMCIMAELTDNFLKTVNSKSTVKWLVLVQYFEVLNLVLIGAATLH